MKPTVERKLAELQETYPYTVQCRNSIIDTFDGIARCYTHGGKMLVCGNGGSAADAEHIVGELMKSFRLERPIPQEFKKKLESMDMQTGQFVGGGLQRALPALCLSSHTALLTAFANDVHADLVFAQQVYGYAQKHDCLVALSTSGNSKNVCHAAFTAKALGLFVAGMTGETGGTLKQYCSVTITVPSTVVYRIQEMHQQIYHTLCLMLEEEFFGC